MYSISFGVLILLSACSKQQSQETSVAQSEEDYTEHTINPLVEEFEGPYGGVPAFDKMDLSLIEPAFQQAMALALEDYEKITNNTDPANFVNYNCSYGKGRNRA